MADDRELALAIRDQVNQMSRVAHALEMLVRMQIDTRESFDIPCKVCGCRLIPLSAGCPAPACPACGG